MTPVTQSRPTTRTPVDGGAEMWLTWDAESGRTIYADALLECLGYAPGAWPKRRHAWESRLHPDDRVAALGAIAQVTAGVSTEAHHAHRLRCADGTWRWLLAHAVNESEAPDGTALRVRVTLRDIDAWESAQSAAQEVVNSVEGIVWEADATTFAFTFVSARAESVLGYPIADWLSDPHFWPQHIHPDDRAWCVPFCQAQTRAARDHRFEYRMMHADGHAVWLRDTVTVILRDGIPHRLRGVMLPIDDLHAATEALHRERMHLEAAQSLATLGSIEVDFATGTLQMSEALRALAGVDTLDALGGIPALLRFVHPDDRALLAGRWERLVAGRRSTSTAEELIDNALQDRFRVLRPDGQERRVVTSYRISRRADGMPSSLLVVVRDVTDEERHSADLRRANERTATLIETMMDAIISCTADGRIVTFNHAAEVMFRIPAAEAIGSSIRRFLPESHRERHDQQMHGFAHGGTTSRRMGAAATPLPAMRADGSAFVIEASLSRNVVDGEPIVSAICRDVSDRVRAEQERMALMHQLQQAQRMETVGRLTGGVAHDFNNLLTVIMGNASLLLAGAELSAEAREVITDIERTGQRAASVARQLLAFSRPQPLTPMPVDLADTVGALARLVGRLLGEDIKLKLALGAEPVIAQADAGLIDQVLLNLVVNARDAMPRGGTLTLSVSQQFAGPAGFPEPPSGWARIDVRDSGIGIPPEDIERIFEPFYSTKPSGAGTGLGLAMAKSILEQHQGALTVESTTGEGAHFTLWLPAQPWDSLPARRPEEDEDTTPQSASILVVEDEAVLRKMVVSILRKAGYRVSSARNMPQAIAQYSATIQEFDLLFTDLIMPDGSGVELAAALRELHPAIKVIISTGYDLRGDAATPDAVLLKPYRPPGLLAAVRNVLRDRS